MSGGNGTVGGFACYQPSRAGQHARKDRPYGGLISAHGMDRFGRMDDFYGAKRVFGKAQGGLGRMVSSY